MSQLIKYTVHLQEDSLVNSVGKEMDLSQGKVAPVILNKAGPKLQKACSKLAPIHGGEVKSTPGYNMACKQILHCCLPGWNGPATAQV